MAQKQLPILNRTGLFQHWSGSWDGYKTYYILQRQEYLFNTLLQEFIEYRASLHPSLINQAYCDDNIDILEKIPSEPTYEKLVEALQEHRKKRQHYIYLGQITMLRYQGWLIFLVYIYKPTWVSFSNLKVQLDHVRTINHLVNPAYYLTKSPRLNHDLI